VVLSTPRPAPLAQWQSNGLLIRRFWVRIPGGVPGPSAAPLATFTRNQSGTKWTSADGDTSAFTQEQDISADISLRSGQDVNFRRARFVGALHIAPNWDFGPTGSCTVMFTDCTIDGPLIVNVPGNAQVAFVRCRVNGQVVFNFDAPAGNSAYLYVDKMLAVATDGNDCFRLQRSNGASGQDTQTLSIIENSYFWTNDADGVAPGIPGQDAGQTYGCRAVTFRNCVFNENDGTYDGRIEPGVSAAFTMTRGNGGTRFVTFQDVAFLYSGGYFPLNFHDAADVRDIQVVNMVMDIAEKGRTGQLVHESVAVFRDGRVRMVNPRYEDGTPIPMSRFGL
jgi:hypothetical protein